VHIEDCHLCCHHLCSSQIDFLILYSLHSVQGKNTYRDVHVCACFTLGTSGQISMKFLAMEDNVNS
jgi:hypothetical protein